MLGVQGSISTIWLEQYYWYSLQVQKHAVGKEMNCSLLEKLRYLLSNAQLDKLFCAEALEYASHLMNWLSSTTVEGKTPLGIGRSYSRL